MLRRVDGEKKEGNEQHDSAGLLYVQNMTFTLFFRRDFLLQAPAAKRPTEVLLVVLLARESNVSVLGTCYSSSDTNT